MNKYLLAILLPILLISTGCSLSDKNDPTDENRSEDQIIEKRDLSNSNLEKIPDEIFDIQDLGELDASNNKLTGAVQSEIGQLRNLRILNLSNNKLTGVPAEIHNLKELKSLDLSNNQLTGLPFELGYLKKLETLNVSGNEYSRDDLNNIKINLPETNIIQ